MLQILKKARAPRLLLAAVLCTALTVSGCGKKDEGGKTVVATYKGGEITQTEMNTFGSIFFSQYGPVGDNPELQEYLLKQLATMKILSAKATDEARKEGEAEAKEQIKQMEEYYNSQGKDAFTNQLKELKITKEDLETYVTMSTVVVKDTNKKVTDQQLKDSYDAKLKADSHAFDVASVAHILISQKDPNDQTKDLRTKEEAKKRADEVKGKLNQGGDFAALAKEYSDDPGSKENGGIYENEMLGTTMWDPAFKKAAIDQPVGKIGEPFESSFGYHIMRVDKRQAESFDNLKEQLKGELADKFIGDFIEGELPNMEFKITAPAASPAASAEASPAASPAASASPAAK
jgi:foldase protein PrsA